MTAGSIHLRRSAPGASLASRRVAGRHDWSVATARTDNGVVASGSCTRRQRRPPGVFGECTVKRRMTRKLRRARIAFAVIVLGAWAMAAAGCYTVQGVGRDITAAGEAGEEFLQRGG